MKLHNKKIGIAYSIYLFAMILKIIILLASAKFFDDETFIKFNTYIIIVDLSILFINSSSLNYLMINNDDLNAPIICENLIFAIIFIPIFFFIYSGDSLLYFLILLLLLRINLNVLCRFLQTNNKIIESLIYNFVGNSIWIISPILIYYYYESINIKIFFLSWIFSLTIANIFYFIKHPTKFKLNLNILNNYFRFYFQNFHFAILFKSFLNIERLVFYNLFNSFQLLSTYTIFTKLINLAYELTTGFLIHKKVGKNFEINIFLSIGLIFVINFLIYIFFSFDYAYLFLNTLLSGKLYINHYDLLPFLLLSISFLTVLRLFYIDFVKKRLFKKLLFINLLIYLSFLLIILFKLTIFQALLIESIFLIIVCIYSYKVIYHEAKI